MYYAQYNLTIFGTSQAENWETVQNAANLMKAMLIPAAIVTPFVAKALKKCRVKSDKSGTVIFGMALGLIFQALCAVSETQSLAAGRYSMFFTF